MLASRERFWRTMRFQPVDRLPYWADWLGPAERWQCEGLPIDADLADGARVRQWFVDHFGFEGMYSAFWGNVDKRALARGRAAIDAGIARLAPVAEQGGFIPLVDHGVPDDVPYENYMYYLEQRVRMAGRYSST